MTVWNMLSQFREKLKMNLNDQLEKTHFSFGDEEQILKLNYVYHTGGVFLRSYIIYAEITPRFKNYINIPIYFFIDQGGVIPFVLA